MCSSVTKSTGLILIWVYQTHTLTCFLNQNHTHILIQPLTLLQFVCRAKSTDHYNPDLLQELLKIGTKSKEKRIGNKSWIALYGSLPPPTTRGRDRQWPSEMRRGFFLWILQTTWLILLTLIRIKLLITTVTSMDHIHKSISHLNYKMLLKPHEIQRKIWGTFFHFWFICCNLSFNLGKST